MVTSGYLIQFFGWPAVFYGIGILSIVWFFAWAYVVHDSPASHPRISEQEAQYIQDAIGQQATTVSQTSPLPIFPVSESQWDCGMAFV
jgi:MFS family permease